MRAPGEEQKPMRIVAIYDNKGKTVDRYTVITDEQSDPDMLDLFDSLSFSETPDDPQYGISQWSSVLRSSDRYNMDNNQWRGRADLGKRIRFEDLPVKLQAHVAWRVTFVDGDEL